MAVLWLAGLAGAGVLVWQRWNWLALAVFAVALPQWAVWLAADHSPVAILLVLAAFGALNGGAAVGFELRVPSARLRPSSAMLLPLNAIVLALAGWFALGAAQAPALAHVWLGAVAVAHLAVGLETVSTQCNRDVRLLALARGVVLFDVTLATGPRRARPRARVGDHDHRLRDPRPAPAGRP